MFARALVAFLVLPGMVAGVFPILIVIFDPMGQTGFWFGYVIIALGLFLLFWCVRDFFVSGEGILAPWDPPARLVIVGLYRHVRNPMYVSVLVVLVGWCVIGGSAILVAYTVLFVFMFHFRVTRNEEVWLARQFSSDWTTYSGAVNRRLPRLKPWYPNAAGI